VSRSLSIYLDVLRFSAALWVFTAHASLLLPAIGLPALWWTAEDAVMGFFVLSGFVVSYTSTQKHAGLPDYFVARLSRLWSVAVPALLFAFLVDQIGRHVAPALDPAWAEAAWAEGIWAEAAPADGGWPAARLLVGLLFLNELWFNTIRIPANTPYWSIGYEFWYYVLFGFAFYLRGRRRVVAVIAAALIAGPKILMLAPIWAMGVLAHRIVGRGGVGPRAGWALFLGSLAAYFAAYVLEVRPALEWRAFMLTPTGIDLNWSSEFWWKLLVGAMAVANIVGFAAVADRIPLRSIEAPVRWLSGMTFSIYLFHWPLLLLVMIGAAGLGWPEAWRPWWSVLILAAVLAAIAGLAELSERRKRFARRAVEAALALVTGERAAMGKRRGSAV
jgi:peptidoglycan/LPS O-acetylase OafA/YrhL